MTKDPNQIQYGSGLYGDSALNSDSTLIAPTQHSIAIERSSYLHQPPRFRATLFNIDPDTGFKSVVITIDSPVSHVAAYIALRQANATQFRVEKLSGVSLPELKKWFENWGLTLDETQPTPPSLPPPTKNEEVGEMPPFVKLSTEDQENVVMYLSNDFGFSFDALLEAYCEKLHAEEINDIVKIVKEKNLS